LTGFAPISGDHFMSDPGLHKRYSLAFKQKVVAEIEAGKFSVSQARRIYDISFPALYRWLRKLGKGHLIAKVVRIEMKDEKDKLKELQHQNQKLESALAQAHLRLLMYECLVESVEAHYQIDVKKTFGSSASNTRSSKSKSKA
jgi:transposase-like protein